MRHADIDMDGHPSAHETKAALLRRRSRARHGRTRARARLRPHASPWIARRRRLGDRVAKDRGSAGISFSTAAASEGAGPLLGADGSELTSFAPGWQLLRTPWSSFVSNPYYGGGNEKSVDPTTLAFAVFVVQQDGAGGTAIPFDFCVYGLSFYK